MKDFPNPGTGIVVVQPKANNNYKAASSATAAPTSCYALVEFKDVDYAITVLNGMQFDGRTLRVSREKTNFGGSGGGFGSKGKFGSSRWAGSDAGFDRSPSSSTTNHTSADEDVAAASNRIHNMVLNDDQFVGQERKIDKTLNGDEAIVHEIESAISSEFKANSDDITTAIACTAAMTLLSSVNAFGLDEEDDLMTNHTDDSVGAVDLTTQDFQSRCKMPLSDLLAEYGEQDGDWKNHQHPQNAQDLVNVKDFQQRREMPLSDLLAEYGDQDVNWKKDQTRSTISPDEKTRSRSANTVQTSRTTKQQTDANNTENNMLAPFGKAFIHLELVSFGYKYGAPSHSKKGFSYAHPLPPLDVRDLDRAPGHVAKFNGLSYLVKRALLNPSKFANADDSGQPDDKADDEQEGFQTNNITQSPMRQRANGIADEIIKMLVESIDEGGHGAISPLTMTISIGSEYGRHRSVVLVEHLAVVLRARLRRNDGRCFNGGRGLGGNGIVRQPVSVGTRHRDVEARHQDEEAFGEDLKREARKAERAKKRDNWDDDSW